MLAGTSDTEEATWAFTPEQPGGRFWEACVGGRRWLFPAELTAIGSLPHNRWFGPEGLLRARWAAAVRTLVVAG